MKVQRNTVSENRDHNSCVSCDNTDLKACACEEKSVVIMNTPGQNVNAGAELVFDMLLNSEFEVTIPS